MSRHGRTIGMIVAVFAVTGVGLGALGFLATNWATTLFLVNAQGETAVQFGPVFVALAAFFGVVLAFFVGPVLAAVLGMLMGSKQRDPAQASIATGAGALVGFLVLGLLVAPGLLLGIGAESSAPFGLGGFVVRLGIASIPTALVGATAGALGVVAAD